MNQDAKDSKSPLEWAVRLFREHPAIAITATYFFFTIVGLFYETSIYRQFGIQIFDVSSPSDFFIACAKAPFITIFAAFCYVLFISTIYTVSFIRKGRPWRMSHPIHWIVNYTGMAIVLVMGPLVGHAYGSLQAIVIMNGGGPKVDLELSGAASVHFPADLSLIGTRGGFFFLYSESTSAVYTIPISKVQLVRHKTSGQVRLLWYIIETSDNKKEREPPNQASYTDGR